MKPAPPKKISYTDSGTSFRVESDPKTNITQVYAPNGEVLWILKEYIGRKIIHLSPDGQSLILIGNQYFGGLLSTNEQSKVFEVYKKGTLKTSYTFEEFFGMSIATAIREFDIPQMGGGWFAMMRYVRLEQINWEQSQIELHFLDERTRKVDF